VRLLTSARAHALLELVLPGSKDSRDHAGRLAGADTCSTRYPSARSSRIILAAMPATVYRPSSRPLPQRLPPVEYPAHFEVRLVSRNSDFRWNRHWVCVTHTLAGGYVGLEEVDDGLWDVYFGPVKLGGWTSGSCASKITRAAPSATRMGEEWTTIAATVRGGSEPKHCYPCSRTVLSPIFPAVQLRRSVASDCCYGFNGSANTVVNPRVTATGNVDRCDSLSKILVSSRSPS
jgi:hypothetical protein